MILRLPISSGDNLEQSTLISEILNMVRFTIRNPVAWGGATRGKAEHTHTMNCHEELTDIQSGSKLTLASLPSAGRRSCLFILKLCLTSQEISSIQSAESDC